MHKISKRHDALKLVTEISPTLKNSGSDTVPQL